MQRRHWGPESTNRLVSNIVATSTGSKFQVVGICRLPCADSLVAAILRSSGFNSSVAGMRLLCTPSLDRPKVEFRASFHDDGLGAPSGFCSEIGDLLPIAPCGRTSL